MKAVTKILVFCSIIGIAILWATTIKAHENPLGEIPWPEGEKVPCMCENLAIDYELCLKTIGAEECFKKVDHETPNPLSPSPLPDPKRIPNVPEMEEGDPLPEWPNVVIFQEVLPCHDANTFITRMQNELGMQAFAQGTATVRNGQNFEFSAPDMVMLVNIKTGDYMMMGIWPNGLGCVLAGGKNFKPYIVGDKT